MLSLPVEKVNQIIEHCQTVLKAKILTIHELAQLIGRLSSSIQAVFPALLYYRNLQQDKITALHHSKSYDAQVILSQASREGLETWIQCLRIWNGQTLLNPVPDVVIQTDASHQGWGACKSEIHTGGRWSLQEQNLHINHLELMSVDYALQALVKHHQNLHIQVEVNNMTVMSYINHKGGTHSPELSCLAVRIWRWCLHRGITLSVEYLPGV